MAKAAKAKSNGAKKPVKTLELVDPAKHDVSDPAARLRVLKTYKLYIDGKFPRSESERFYLLKDQSGEALANICRGSRKDFRNAASAARAAFPGWSERAAYNRGQILYRIAEMLEGRRRQFTAELMNEGLSAKEAEREVDLSIDRLVYYAGWADKFQQVFSSVNPVQSSHFNFSILEPTGVVSAIAPESPSLLGLVSAIAPVIVGGSAIVILASESKPLSAITFAEVLHSSDVPSGVVNILTGLRSELLSHMTSHMDINAVWCADPTKEQKKLIQENAALNIRRVVMPEKIDWSSDKGESPYFIGDFMETKTTWHPIGI